MGTIRARSPIRIDLAGGWTDVPPFSADIGGCVVNAAISRYSYASLTPNDVNDYVLESGDYDTSVHADDIRQMEYDGNLDLLKAAVRRRGMQMGAHIFTRCEAPPGSGTGSSASMGVTLVGIIDSLSDDDLDMMDVAAEAHLLETEELGIPGGKQDQYAAAIGGIKFMEFHDPKVNVDAIDVSDDFRLELEKHLLLVYTGKSRLSGNIISRVMGAYRDDDEGVITALKNISEAGRRMRKAMVKQDLQQIGEVLNFNWENQKQLYPEMTTPKIEALFSVAEPKGVLGRKACGAGGGGCILYLCKPDCEHRVVQAVEDLGGRVIDFQFDNTGLQVWRAVQ